MEVDRWNKYINLLNPQSLLAHDFVSPVFFPLLLSPRFDYLCNKALDPWPMQCAFADFLPKVVLRCFREKVRLHIG